MYKVRREVLTWYLHWFQEKSLVAHQIEKSHKTILAISWKGQPNSANKRIEKLDADAVHLHTNTLYMLRRADDQLLQY